MNDLREKVFQKVKSKLNKLRTKTAIEKPAIDTFLIKLEGLSDEDEVIYETVDRIADYIMEFCNRSDIPQGLFYIWVDMAFDYHKSILAELVQTSENSGESTQADVSGDIKSFSVEGVSMTFVTSIELEEHNIKMRKAQTNAETLLAAYKDILYKYRKIRR